MKLIYTCLGIAVCLIADAQSATSVKKIFFESKASDAISLGHEILLCGETMKTGTSDRNFIVHKIDTLGQTIWAKTYGTKNSESFEGCIKGPGNSVFIAGTTLKGLLGSRDFILMKIDTDGNQLWTKVYGGAGIDQVKGISSVGDSLFIVSGNSGNKAHAIAVDTSGAIVWSKQLYSLGETFVTGTATESGNALLAGITRRYASTSSNIEDLFLTEFSDTGDTLKTISIGNEADESPAGIYNVGDSNTIIFGTVNDSAVHGYFRAFITRIDKDGNTIHGKRFMVSDTVLDVCGRELIVVNDSSYLLLLEVGPAILHPEVLKYMVVVALDKSFNVIGNRKFNTFYTNIGWQEMIPVGKNNDKLLMLSTSSAPKKGAITMVFIADRDTTCENDSAEIIAKPYGMGIIPRSFTLSSGASMADTIMPDSVVTLNDSVICAPVINYISNADKAVSGLKIFPNPAMDYAWVSAEKPITKLEVYNSVGALVISQTATCSNCLLNIAHLNPGLYFVRGVLQNQEETHSRIIKH